MTTLKIVSAHFQEDPRCGQLLALTALAADGQKVRKVLLPVETERLLTHNGLCRESLTCGAVIELPDPPFFQIVSMRELDAIENAEIGAAMAEGIPAVRRLLKEAREQSYRHGLYKGYRWSLAGLMTLMFEKRLSRKAAMKRYWTYTEGPLREWSKSDCSHSESLPLMGD